MPAVDFKLAEDLFIFGQKSNEQLAVELRARAAYHHHPDTRHISRADYALLSVIADRLEFGDDR